MSENASEPVDYAAALATRLRDLAEREDELARAAEGDVERYHLARALRLREAADTLDEVAEGS